LASTVQNDATETIVSVVHTLSEATCIDQEDVSLFFDVSISLMKGQQFQFQQLFRFWNAC